MERTKQSKGTGSSEKEAVILSKLVREGRTDTAPSEQHPNLCSAGGKHSKQWDQQVQMPWSRNVLAELGEQKGGHCGCAK